MAYHKIATRRKSRSLLLFPVVFNHRNHHIFSITLRRGHVGSISRSTKGGQKSSVTYVSWTLGLGSEKREYSRKFPQHHDRPRRRRRLRRQRRLWPDVLRFYKQPDGKLQDSLTHEKMAKTETNVHRASTKLYFQLKTTSSTSLLSHNVRYNYENNLIKQVEVRVWLLVETVFFFLQRWEELNNA